MSEYESDESINQSRNDIYDKMEEIDNLINQINSSDLTEEQKQEKIKEQNLIKEELQKEANSLFNKLDSKYSGRSSDQSTIRSNDSINDTINEEITSALDIAENIDDAISNLNLRGVKEKLTGKVSQEDLKKYQDTLNFISSDLLKKIKEKIDKTKNYDAINAYKEFYDNIKKIGEKLEQLVNDTTIDEEAAKKEIKNTLLDLLKEKDILDAKITDTWYEQFGLQRKGFRAKVVKLIFALAYLLAALGAGWIALLIAGAIFSELFSGCYMFAFDSEGKSIKYKISKCDIKKENCKCGKLISPGDSNFKKIPNTDICDSLGECDLPYCIGRCTTNSTLDRCENISGDFLFQCTNVKNDNRDFIYYAYREYSPYTFIANLIDWIEDVAKDAGKAFDDSFKFLDWILKNLPTIFIFLCIIFIAYIILQFIKVFKK
jgi:uncharacterized membrane protein